MILVTGATGHIGNVLVRYLRERGETVRALIFPGEDTRPIEGLGVEMVEGDVLDIESLRCAMDGVNIVYHLAGVISIMPGKYPLLYRVNVGGTQNILQVCKEKGVERLIYTSSIHALGAVEHGILLDERLGYNPDHVMGDYDRTKALASLEVLNAVQRDGLDAVVVCPTGVIGPYDFRQSEMGSLIYGFTQRKTHFIIDGAYDFVDVRDVAKGQILACEHGRTGESYILSGERLNLANLVNLVEEINGVWTSRINLPLWLAKTASVFTPAYYQLFHAKPQFTPYSIRTITSNSNISHAKAQTELGYHPRLLRETVHDTVTWIRDNQWLWNRQNQKSGS